MMGGMRWVPRQRPLRFRAARQTTELDGGAAEPCEAPAAVWTTGNVLSVLATALHAGAWWALCVAAAGSPLGAPAVAGAVIADAATVVLASVWTLRQRPSRGVDAAIAIVAVAVLQFAGSLSLPATLEERAIALLTFLATLAVKVGLLAKAVFLGSDDDA